ncbi:hypothetical protein PPACK8108_LOCUS23912 [Phakopsora pachyrhizi]|uniref:Chromatin modification-related protein EAF6 n=1 Tax=Phakopsora pachyrhizi TaxID=170000 RepID=A0AAV0BNK9_PHAPC|nr:hypothetical protein PPACK8108_LOCUS23912 [Phakopsora pachyrhizi]
MVVDQESIIKLEESKRELALNLAKKKLDKELEALETTLYEHGAAYLTDPLAKSFSNIVKGYETTIVRKDIKRRDIRENLEGKKVILDQSNLDCVCTISHPTVAGHGKFQKRAPALIDKFSNLLF